MFLPPGENNPLDGGRLLRALLWKVKGDLPAATRAASRVGTGFAFVLIALGGVLAAVSYAHWERNERAMRLGERLPHSPIPRVVAAVLALSALAALVLTIVDLVQS